jgi:hypothetical protein
MGVAFSRKPGQARCRIYNRVPTLQCRIHSRHTPPRANLVVFLLGKMILAPRKACVVLRDGVRAVRQEHEIS